jgi:hypothetical protein
MDCDCEIELRDVQVEVEAEIALRERVVIKSYRVFALLGLTDRRIILVNAPCN